MSKPDTAPTMEQAAIQAAVDPTGLTPEKAAEVADAGTELARDRLTHDQSVSDAGTELARDRLAHDQAALRKDCLHLATNAPRAYDSRNVLEVAGEFYDWCTTGELREGAGTVRGAATLEQVEKEAKRKK